MPPTRVNEEWMMEEDEPIQESMQPSQESIQPSQESEQPSQEFIQPSHEFGQSSQESGQETTVPDDIQNDKFEIDLLTPLVIVEDNLPVENEDIEESEHIITPTVAQPHVEK
ncbi:hypothetical protein CEXT_777001 [Caerostris extrusa]|uniref:Uncharacterized protein n=1 Tax=Caerostris extrusa TaxID=172846 RepID=A0AAV4N6E9_CAEEX|nr:hypothetical protein CEXT_777001 [Caerostris extrusa]